MGILAEHQVQGPVVEPGDFDGFFIETRREEQGVVSPFLEAHRDLVGGDIHGGGRINEVAEERLRLGALVTLPDLLAMRVSWRSQSTFMGTAEERASI